MKLDSFGIYNSISSETSQINIFQVRELVQLHCDVVIAFDSDVSLEEIKKERYYTTSLPLYKCICCI